MQGAAEPGEGLSNLVAEDNSVNQRLAARLLEKRGHRVTVAGNGQEALDALSRSPFELVLMDVQMPEMDGLTATSVLRERERGRDIHLPVIPLTAHAMKGDQDRCLAAVMMDSYLTKPIRPQELAKFSRSNSTPAIALVTQHPFPNPSPVTLDSSPAPGIKRGHSSLATFLSALRIGLPNRRSERLLLFMPLSILRATLADLDSLLLLMRHMQRDDPWAEAFDELCVRNNLAELLHDPRYGLICLVREKDNPVAYLVICFDFSLEYRGKGAWIDELFVEPAHRGQGIGTRLLDLAETVSSEHGAQTLHLEVNHGNRAIELYRRRAFVDHHRHLMTKWLTPSPS